MQLYQCTDHTTTSDIHADEISYVKEIVAKWRTHQELQTFTTLITLLKWKKK